MITKIKTKLSSFFKKEEVLRKPPWWSECWDFITKQTVGTTFLYLGRQMMITRYNFDYYGLCEFGTSNPSITCTYSDDSGQLHEWVFPTLMLPLVQIAIEKQTHNTSKYDN